ncbi:MAG TPA: family 16 glycoside hydrolase [Ohtaekwangia sp.]|nr:family 16 glycoside hydrolase [Ohtaekwangia sp.]
MMNELKKLFVVLMLLTGVMARAQQASMQELPLADMSAFRPQAGNWQIVGTVMMNPDIDIHEMAKPAPEAPTKRRKSKEPEKAPLKVVSFQPGKGILLNMNDDTRKDHLVTNFVHGDLELELEVMLPKGSNSGIYLQGRYEVQLLDSWGVKHAKYSDIGGIYRNWETEPGKIYMGKAPLSNPAKAPGLWQKMKISFRAPRFDANGKKIANAKFVFVDLNGVRIHDNVEVPLPTGGPLENNEVSEGPLMIQGDHGPVAFRNIRYQPMKNIQVSVSEITFKTYRGKFKEIADFVSATPLKTGTSEELTCEVLEDENAYGAVYTGKVTVPENNKYNFQLAYTGGAKLVVNGETLVDNQRPDAGGWNGKTITLKAGTYPFEIYNFKDASWMPPRLGLFVRTAQSNLVTLHAYNSYPPEDEPTSPILIGLGNEPKLLRAFVDFKGDRQKRLTHTIGVGDPAGVHYVYDLGSGNLACVWRGAFVDATPMWHERGDGSFKPRGATQYLFMNQALAFLSTPADAFPATGTEGAFKPRGYVLDESTGRPVFRYTYQGLEVEDKVLPSDDNRSIRREVTIKNRGTQTGLYLKLAEGASIVKLENGAYAIDDQQYYIRTAAPVSVREVDGKKELIAVVDRGAINYSIIW